MGDKTVKKFLFYVLYTALAVLFIFPLVYMVVSSFKNDDQIVRDMSSIAAFIPYGELSVQNYRDVLCGNRNPGKCHDGVCAGDAAV